MVKQSSKSVEVRIDGDGIAVIELKSKDGKPFILNLDTLNDLDAAIDEVREHLGIRGAIVRSEHETVFCAGADVDAIASADASASAGREVVRRGQSVFQNLEDLACPVVAIIEGTAVGGGFELCLACDVRLAATDRPFKVGLPEVRLGILPAWGGTTRLPEVTGLKTALPLLLTGKLLDARRAERAGIMRAVGPSARLEAHAREIILQAQGKPGSLRKVSLLDWFVDEVATFRNFYIGAARKRVLAETKGYYPAPLAILDTLQKGAGKSRETRFAMEQDAVIELLASPASRNLLSVYVRSLGARRGPGYDVKGKNVRRLERIGVVGGGVMGSGIALALLLKGKEVRVVDPFAESLVKTKKSVDKELKKRAGRRQITRAEARQIGDRLELSTGFEGLAGCELVIEAVPEVPEIKADALAKIAAAAPSDAIIATNTSSLSLAVLSESVPRSGRFAGLHFFNPAPKMPLVEIIRGPDSSKTCLAHLVKFCFDIGKTPVLCNDSPGFAVNRLLAPYLQEGARLVIEENASVEKVDAAARAFGLPMGPLELMDTVGLDVAAHVSDYMETFGFGIKKDPLLDRMVERGQLGRKTGKGFYLYDGKKKKTYEFDAVAASTGQPPGRAVITSCLTRALGDAAKWILEQEVVDGEDDLDLASIYGMGFPPYTGGIATWLSESGGQV